jgi:hypothetical protein
MSLGAGLSTVTLTDGFRSRYALKLLAVSLLINSHTERLAEHATDCWSEPVQRHR